MGHRDDGCPINFCVHRVVFTPSKWSISMPWGKRALFSCCFCGALFFLLLVVRLLSLWFLSGLLFSLRLRRSGVACFAVRLLVFPFFSPLLAFGDESGRACLQSIGKVDTERQMVADAPMVERTEVGAEGLGERAAAEWFEQRGESEEMNGLQGGVEPHCGREERG